MENSNGIGKEPSSRGEGSQPTVTRYAGLSLSMKKTRRSEGIDVAGETVIKTCIVSSAAYQGESTCGKLIHYLSMNPVGPL